jgi:hypothetical protein
MPLDKLPPPSANGVDKLYHQLAEIHAIAATQRSAPAGTGLTQPLAGSCQGQLAEVHHGAHRGKDGTTITD